jgi:Tfp pilus assembly protein PilO
LLLVELYSAGLIGKSKELFLEKKQILIFVVAIAGFGGFVLFRYIPMSRNISAVKTARAEQNLMVSKGISDQEQMQIFSDQLRRLQDKLVNYDAGIPKQKDLGRFLKTIAELMNGYNLKEQAIQPLDEIEADELICIPVSLGCKGKLTEIFGFFKKLQTLDRKIRIQHVKLTNGNDFSGELKMDTEIVIYYKPRAD